MDIEVDDIIEIEGFVEIGFILDSLNKRHQACKLFHGERFKVVDTYTFYSYASKYRAYNNTEMPIIAIEYSENDSDEVYGDLLCELEPESFKMVGIGDLTVLDESDLIVRLTSIEVYQKQKQTKEFLVPFIKVYNELFNEDERFKLILANGYGRSELL